MARDAWAIQSHQDNLLNHKQMRLKELQERIQNSRGILLVLIVCNTVVYSAMHYLHEPWRDEIEMWLMARDASVAQLLALAPDMGTPLLWPLLLKPFALLGTGLAGLQCVHICFAVGYSWLILFRSPFSVLSRVLLLSSYYLHFEYGVVARNYTLGVFFLFGIATLYTRRTNYVWRYGLLLFLLCHTSVHFLFIATVLLLELCYEALREKNTRLFPAIVFGALGVLSSVYILYPSESGQFSGVLFSNYNPYAVPVSLRDSLFPKGSSPLELSLALATWLVATLSLLAMPRVLYIFLGSLFSLLYIFCFKHVGGSWHFGLLFVVMVFAFWLRAENELRYHHSNRRLQRIAELAFNLWQPLFYFALCVSIFENSKLYYNEFSYPHSLSGEMADYLQRNEVLAHTIAAHPAPVAAAVLGYLPGVKFWYPSDERFGTYMLWNKKFAENRFLSSQEVVARIKRRFPKWESTDEPVFLLLNEFLPKPNEYGYVLYYATPEKPWRVKDEKYFLYVPMKYLDAIAETSLQ